MEVHCGEGLANHIGPEPCAGVREGVGEASAGECAGQPLSLDSEILGADAVSKAEGNTTTGAFASRWAARRGQRPWHAHKLLVDGNREISGLTGRASGPARVGKARSRSR